MNTYQLKLPLSIAYDYELDLYTICDKDGYVIEYKTFKRSAVLRKKALEKVADK